jgi:hypothetical protein
MNRSFPHWLCANNHKYSDHEEKLPFDQHELIALMAPRAVYVGGGTDDLWGDPRGCYLALSAASPVYALYGQPPIPPDKMPGGDQQFIAGTRGTHMHVGPHNLRVFDWKLFMNFTDALWNRKSHE